MPQLLCFSRMRRTQVEKVDDTTLKVACTLCDTLTDAYLEITAQLPDLVITAIDGKVRRSPRKACADAGKHLRKAVGVRIGAGMTEIINGTLRHDVACEELIFMLEECAHGVILSLTRDVLAEAPADVDGKHDFFCKMVRKNVRLYNRCAAFAPGSSLVEGMEPPK